MLNYLTSNGYLDANYREDDDFAIDKKRKKSGNIRYYSYRALLIAKTLQRLLDAGVQLSRVKRALQRLKEDVYWIEFRGEVATERTLGWLISDGSDVYIQDERGFMEIVSTGQKSFAFIMQMNTLRSEVESKIRALCPEKMDHFDLRNTPPLFEERRRTSKAIRAKRP